MQIATVKIIEQVLKADTSVDQATRTRVMKAARTNGDVPAPGNGHEQPRIYSRKEAAILLGGKTVRYVDQLCKRGLLARFTPRGNKRGIGITSVSLNNFLTQ